MNLLDRFRRFMIGRYGSDQLNMAMLVGYIILSMVYSFTRWTLILILGYALAILVFYRMFSKNTNKRWKENQKFLHFYTPLANRLKHGVSSAKKASPKSKSDKNNKVFQCGKCGQLIRVPRGKGKIAITCPKCKQEFVKRT